LDIHAQHFKASAFRREIFFLHPKVTIKFIIKFNLCEFQLYKIRPQGTRSRIW